jgi:hypothetical protein
MGRWSVTLPLDREKRVPSSKLSISWLLNPPDPSRARRVRIVLIDGHQKKRIAGRWNMASPPGRIVVSDRGARELYFEQEMITSGLRSFDFLETVASPAYAFLDRGLPPPLSGAILANWRTPLCLTIHL